MRWLARSALLVLPCCASAPPATHYYRLVVPPGSPAPAAAPRCTVTIEPPSVDVAYDTERMVYRKSPYRIDYYRYHSWSAAPSLHVADYLREAYTRAAAFVPARSAGTSLQGRLLAFEEVDVTEREWVGRVKLELWLEHARSGRSLWSGTFEERAPMPRQDPEGLAMALSAALDRIVHKTAPAIARAAMLGGACDEGGSAVGSTGLTARGEAEAPAR